MAPAAVAFLNVLGMDTHRTTARALDCLPLGEHEAKVVGLFVHRPQLGSGFAFAINVLRQLWHSLLRRGKQQRVTFWPDILALN